MSLILSALLVLAPQAAQPAPGARGEVAIPARSGGSVRRYAAYQPDVVFLQDYRDVWYRAKLTGPCFSQPPYRRGIAFRSRGGNQAVDRFSTLVLTATGRNCGIASLVLGEPPRGVRSIAGNGSDR